MNKTDILIVTYAGHFAWLRYCLHSIVAFASGFNQVKILIPEGDLSAMNSLLTEFCDHQGVQMRVGTFEDWPGKGFLRHEHLIICADEHCEGDFICHVDSDCLFTEPVTPQDYFVGDKPVLMHASFDWLAAQQANLLMWKKAAENALGWSVHQETMRRHPAVHYRKTYQKTRECIQKHTRKSCTDYIKSCDNAFPQTFARSLRFILFVCPRGTMSPFCERR